MSLVERVEISLREFIIRRHQFQLQRRMEKACQQMRFTDWFWKVLSPNGLSVLLARRKKRKIMILCACLTRVINGKIIEDEAIYNFWRFLVEDFFSPVIKLPGTYLNNKLLSSCRSSKFSSSFPATSVLWCAPLDPVRPDRNSKSAWRQSVLIFLRQTLHWKLRRAATFLIK